MERGRMNLKHTKAWNCSTYIKRLQIDKLEARYEKCRFIGYPKEIMGYCLHQPSDHKVFLARWVTFLKRKLLVEASHVKTIKFDEAQVSNEIINHEHWMNTERHSFDVLKLQKGYLLQWLWLKNQLSSKNKLMDQSLDKLKTQYKSLLKGSTWVHHAPDKLNLMVQDDALDLVFIMMMTLRATQRYAKPRPQKWQ